MHTHRQTKQQKQEACELQIVVDFMEQEKREHPNDEGAQRVNNRAR